MTTTKSVSYSLLGDYFAMKQLASVWSPSYADMAQQMEDIENIQEINRWNGGVNTRFIKAFEFPLSEIFLDWRTLADSYMYCTVYSYDIVHFTFL